MHACYAYNVLTSRGWLNPHPLPDIAFFSPLSVCLSEACPANPKSHIRINVVHFDATPRINQASHTFDQIGWHCKSNQWSVNNKNTGPWAELLAVQCCTCPWRCRTFPMPAEHGAPRMMMACRTAPPMIGRSSSSRALPWSIYARERAWLETENRCQKIEDV
jgi:hypothetical protein